jgi:hypothetical protein
MQSGLYLKAQNPDMIDAEPMAKDRTAMNQTIFAGQKVEQVQQQFHMIDIQSKSASGKNVQQMKQNMLLCETAQVDTGKKYGDMQVSSKQGLN